MGLFVLIHVIYDGIIDLHEGCIILVIGVFFIIFISTPAMNRLSCQKWNQHIPKYIIQEKLIVWWFKTWARVLQYVNCNLGIGIPDHKRSLICPDGSVRPGWEGRAVHHTGKITNLGWTTMKVIARGLPVYLHPSLGYNNTRDYLVMRWNFYRKNDSFISTINEINLDLGRIHLVHLRIHKYFTDDPSINFHDVFFLHFLL